MFVLSFLAVETAVWVVAVSVAVSLALLLIIVVAPWKDVREEPELDEETETRLLLGEDPEAIERDLEAREEERRQRVANLRPREEE